jgi:thiamine transport system substrate-binding protein
MQFIVSDGFQSHIPTGNWMYPVVDSKLPAGFETLTIPAKALSFSPDEVANNRKAWIREWQSALIK